MKLPAGVPYSPPPCPGPAAGADVFREVFAALGLGVCLVDAGGAVLLGNRAAERLLGRPPGGLAGRDLQDVAGTGRRPGDRPAGTACRLRDALREGRAARCDEDVFLRADGAPLEVMWTCTPLSPASPDGGAVVAFQDVTARRDERARHEALLASGERALQRAEDVNAALAWLAEVTMELVSAADTEERLGRLARLLVPRLADRAALDLVAEPGLVRRAACADRSGAVGPVSARGAPQQFRVPPSEPLGLVLLGSGTQQSAPGAAGPGGGPPAPPAPPVPSPPVRWQEQPGLGAAVALVVPLRLREHTYGAMTLARTGSGRAFTPAEVELAEEVGLRATLTLENARLYAEQADIAATLQRSMLTDLPPVEGLELAARYRPAGRSAEIGGDWYDAFPLPGGPLALAVGDVAGHDLQAATRMGALRNMLRALAVDRPEPPGSTLHRLDTVMSHLDAADSATAVYGHLHRAAAGAWRFDWSSAGHPPPLLVRPDGRTTLLAEGHGALLGILPDTPRLTAVVPLPPGATLLLYTDGLVESRLRPLDTGLERLRREAAVLAGLPLGELCTALMDSLGTADDDVTVIAVRVPARG
ncbi:SpoIIE family protein phosphatase [Streptomyces sp. NPDC001380]|uniref:SpoIIE family protein phosphatase n=1 Tax=Streptomyces sp. NPDC001380 TaxID=3364566 RepID=UPI0036A43FB9